MTVYPSEISINKGRPVEERLTYRKQLINGLLIIILFFTWMPVLFFSFDLLQLSYILSISSIFYTAYFSANYFNKIVLSRLILFVPLLIPVGTLLYLPFYRCEGSLCGLGFVILLYLFVIYSPSLIAITLLARKFSSKIEEIRSLHKKKFDLSAKILFIATIILLIIKNLETIITFIIAIIVQILIFLVKIHIIK